MTHDQDKIKEATEACYDLKTYVDEIRDLLELTDADGDFQAKCAEIREHINQLAALLEGKI